MRENEISSAWKAMKASTTELPPFISTRFVAVFLSAAQLGPAKRKVATDYH